MGHVNWLYVSKSKEKEGKMNNHLHVDTFWSYSRVSSGGRTSRETNWKTRIDEKEWRQREFIEFLENQQHMQAEIVQWEKSVKAECIFYIDVIRHQKGISLSRRSDWNEPVTGLNFIDEIWLDWTSQISLTKRYPFDVGWHQCRKCTQPLHSLPIGQFLPAFTAGSL